MIKPKIYIIEHVLFTFFIFNNIYCILYYLRFIVEKCDGNLKIENRKKTEMINELVRRGYNSDPVKAWKLAQDRESVMVINILCCLSIQLIQKYFNSTVIIIFYFYNLA